MGNAALLQEKEEKERDSPGSTSKGAQDSSKRKPKRKTKGKKEGNTKIKTKNGEPLEEPLDESESQFGESQLGQSLLESSDGSSDNSNTESARWRTWKKNVMAFKTLVHGTKTPVAIKAKSDFEAKLKPVWLRSGLIKGIIFRRI
jgi:hypothetical protein